LRNANQAGMRWPHQSWREMHHGLMSSSLRGVCRVTASTLLSLRHRRVDGGESRSRLGPKRLKLDKETTHDLLSRRRCASMA
jgi:hypothetical protein